MTRTMIKNAIGIAALVILIAVIAVACGGDGRQSTEREPLVKIGPIDVYEFTLTDGTQCLMTRSQYSTDAVSLECDFR